MSSSYRGLCPNGNGAPLGGGQLFTHFQSGAAPGPGERRMVLIGKRLALAAALLLVLKPSPVYPQSDAIKLRKDNFHVLSAQMKDIVQGLGNGLPRDEG